MNTVVLSQKSKALSLAKALYFFGLCLLAVYYPKFGRYPVYDWLFLSALVVTGARYLSIGYSPRYHSAIGAAVVLFLLGAIVTIIGTDAERQNIFSAVLLIYTFGLWLPLPAILLRRWKDLKKAYSALVVSVAITTIYALGQKLFGWPIYTDENFWGRVTGFTRHPNELGVFCALVFPYALCLATNNRKWVRNMVPYTGVAACILGVILSGSMTGAAALVAGACTYLLLTDRRAKLRVLAGILVGGAVLGGVTLTVSPGHTLLEQRISMLLTSNRGAYSVDQRLVVDRAALAHVQTHPIVGHGYHAALATLGGHEIQVHNTFLRGWYDGGLFTLLALLVVLCGCAVSLGSAAIRLRSGKDREGKRYLAAAAGSYVAIVLAMQVSPVLYQRSSWIAVAIAYAAVAISRDRRRVNPELGCAIAERNASKE